MTCTDKTGCWCVRLKKPLPNLLLYASNTLRLRQNGCHLPVDIFKCIFLIGNVYISIKVSLKFVHKGPIDNFSSIESGNGLVPTRQQAIIWTNDGYIADTYMRQSALISCLNWTISWRILYFWSEVNMLNVNFAWATAFIFDTRTDVLRKVSKFLRRKMSRPEGESNPQPSDTCQML